MIYGKNINERYFKHEIPPKCYLFWWLGLMWPLAQPMKLSRRLLKRSGNDLEINVEIWIFRRSRLLKWSFTPTTGLTRPSMETPMTWHSFRWTRWKLFLAYWVHFTGCLLRPRSCGERCDPRTPNLSPSLWTGGLENDQVLNSIVSLTKGNRSHVWDSRSSRMTVEMDGWINMIHNRYMKVSYSFMDVGKKDGFCWVFSSAPTLTFLLAHVCAAAPSGSPSSFQRFLNQTKVELGWFSWLHFHSNVIILIIQTLLASSSFLKIL